MKSVVRGLLATATLAALAIQPVAAQQVQLTTTLGDIVVELDREKAPKTVANFLQYVQSGHYEGTVFHRVIDGFMVQGGGLTAELASKPTRAPIALESRNGLRNVRGSVAMARTAAADSATSQFFINLQDNPFLDAAHSRDGNGYAVFGKVVSGMEVVDRIRALPTGRKGTYENVPLHPVSIVRAQLKP